MRPEFKPWYHKTNPDQNKTKTQSFEMHDPKTVRTARRNREVQNHRQRLQQLSSNN
jgi:hypothetical protein